MCGTLQALLEEFESLPLSAPRSNQSLCVPVEILARTYGHHHAETDIAVKLVDRPILSAALEREVERTKSREALHKPLARLWIGLQYQKRLDGLWARGA